MTEAVRNIYRNARQVAGMTQERWAEAIGVDVKSVYRYEAGETTPCDEVVTAMAEISGLTALGYWHLAEKSRLGARIVPDVDRLPLPQAVVQLLVAIANFSTMQSDLLRLAADGVISPDEAREWDGIAARLDGVIRAAAQLKCAEGVE